MPGHSRLRRPLRKAGASSNRESRDIETGYPPVFLMSIHYSAALTTACVAAAYAPADVAGLAQMCQSARSNEGCG